MTATQLRGLQRRLAQRYPSRPGHPEPDSPNRLVRERVDQAMADRPVAYIGGQDWDSIPSDRR